MLLTEAEAKTKWCPFARVTLAYRHLDGDGWSTTGQSAFNVARIMPSGTEHRECCIASKCMAWRFANMRLGHDPAHNGREAAERYTRENPLKGVCGLASPPHVGGQP